MQEPNPAAPVLAVFASDRGPGDAERASLMSQAGTYFARRGARLLCLAENGVIPVPLITAARAAGGLVEVVADDSIVLPPALSSVPLTTHTDQASRFTHMGQGVHVLVALPGSLASTSALFGTWSAARARGQTLPVVMLNRHRAYDVMRGFAADVMAPGLPGYDRAVQFADTVEDLWNRVSRLAVEPR